MLVWANNDRKRSNSNSSAGSVGKTSSEKLKPITTSPISHQQLNYSQELTAKPSQVSSNQQKIDLSIQLNLPIEKVQELYTIFTKFDQDRDGVLDVNQFHNLMQSGNQPLTLSTTTKLLKKSPKSPQLTFPKFLTLLTQNHEDSKQQLQKVFRVYDKANKGYIDFDDYIAVSRTIGQLFTMAEMEDAFQLMDGDGDGRVGFGEFCKAMGRDGK